MRNGSAWIDLSQLKNFFSTKKSQENKTNQDDCCEELRKGQFTRSSYWINENNLGQD